MTTLDAVPGVTVPDQDRLARWSQVLHRAGGLATLLFLVIHVIGTAWVASDPARFEELIAVFQSPLFALGEFALAGLVIFHALNGTRIAVLDFRPAWEKHRARATLAVFATAVVVIIPVFILMAEHAIEFYAAHPVDLQIGLLLRAVVLPFGGGIALVLLAGAALSAGLEAAGRPASADPQPAPGSRLERALWRFTRVSGLLILPLVFGHLAIMLVAEGVFALNQGGTALAASFVAARWAYPAWRLYDAALLTLALLHGFNGLRGVINAGAADRPTLRRGLTWAALAACAALIVLGALALARGVPGM